MTGAEPTLTPRRYDHVIWDWNGTLLDDVDLVVDIMNGLLAPRGLRPLDVPRYHEVFTFPVRDYYERLGFDFAREPFEELAIEFITGYSARWPEADLRSGARRGIDELARRGLGQSVLSATLSTMRRSRRSWGSTARCSRAGTCRAIGCGRRARRCTPRWVR